MASMSVRNAAVVICDISNEPMPYRIKIVKLNTFSKTLFCRVYSPYLLLADGGIRWFLPQSHSGVCYFSERKKIQSLYFGEISAYWYNCEESHSERHRDNLRANLFCSESDTSLRFLHCLKNTFLIY